MYPYPTWDETQDSAKVIIDHQAGAPDVTCEMCEQACWVVQGYVQGMMSAVPAQPPGAQAIPKTAAVACTEAQLSAHLQEMLDPKIKATPLPWGEILAALIVLIQKLAA